MNEYQIAAVIRVLSALIKQEESDKVCYLIDEVRNHFESLIDEEIGDLKLVEIVQLNKFILSCADDNDVLNFKENCLYMKFNAPARMVKMSEVFMAIAEGANND